MRKLLLILTTLLFVFTNTAYGASTGSCFDTDSVLMLHMDGSDASTTFTDSSASAHTMTANGNAQIDNDITKFSQTGLFDGSGDYVSTPNSTDWDFGTGDFTIDFQYRTPADPDTNNARVFLAVGDAIDASAGVLVRYTTGGGLSVYINGTQYTFAWTPSGSTFYHVALTRSGSNLRAFIDGTQIGSTQSNSADIQVNQSLFVGAQNDGGVASSFINASLDELRVVKGTAVWTANFTSPVAAYTSCGAVVSGDAGLIGNSSSVQYF